MGNLSSVLKKTVLPVALSFSVLFNGCGNGKSIERDSAKYSSKIESLVDTSPIVDKRKLVLREKDFMYFDSSGSSRLDFVYYDLESGRRTFLGEECGEIFKESGGKSLLDRFGSARENLVEKGYDVGFSPFGFGRAINDLASPNSFRDDFLYLGKEYIKHNEKGDLAVEEILDKMSLAKLYELREMRSRLKNEVKDEPYLVYIKGKNDEGIDYLLERSSYKVNPLEIEVNIYSLEKSKMRPYSTAVSLK